MLRMLAAMATVAVVLVACVEENRPSACDDRAVELTLTLSAEQDLEPSAPAVCEGQEVTLVVDSAIDAVFHVHGYDEALPAAELPAGETTTLSFIAERPGQFPIEIHPADDHEGVEVGILTVHAR